MKRKPSETGKKKRLITASALKSLLLVAFISCSKSPDGFDASGSFEAEETIISAEAQGRLTDFRVEEGQELQAGRQVGAVDSVQLYLKKKQLESQISALLGKKPDIPVQLSALQEQLRTAEKERLRMSRLVEGDAAPAKQLDDIASQIEVLKKQIEAQKSSLSLTSVGISKDVLPLRVQIEQVDDQLRKCRIVNPVNGTVLTKYAEANEMTAVGKPLYKIADLSEIILRAYVTGNQLPLIRLNQRVKVHTDDGQGGYQEAEGNITWISDKAEFTPKTIQTREERASRVYAIKVKVKNDGLYKIGMYGEVLF